MGERIGILLLEDMLSDAEIIRRTLKNTHPNAEFKWVQTREQYTEALWSFKADLVISDHSLPGFNSQEALHLLKEAAIDIPFILVTATISEEFAVTMMKQGVADYLLKDRLQRLPLAITNALEKWEIERQKRRSLDLVLHNERRFRAMIENSHDMITVTDENLRPVYLSQSYARITGRTLDQSYADIGLDLVHPDDRVEYYEMIRKVKENPGKYFSVLYRMSHGQTGYIWLEGTVINLLYDEAVGGILFNLRDITDRKEAEELLMKSQANLTAIVENSNVSIYSIDRQFRYISFNSFLRDTLRQYGLDPKVGDSVFEFLSLFDPTQVDDWKDKYMEAFSRKRVEFEKEFDIAEVYTCVRFSINPIVEGHYVIGLSCFGWDVTPQKIAARKLVQSEARFRALTENNYDAIVMRDERRQVIYASPSVERMLGYAEKELMDPQVDIYVHPDDVSVVKASYEKMLQSPGIPFPISMRIRKKNGVYIWAEGTITNMLHNPNVKGIVSNFRDITERKESEIQREQITLDLVERNNNLEQYAYIVSHNLRAPVANILGLANLIEMDGSTGKDVSTSLAYLFSSARSLDEVIRDLNMILQMRQSINEQTEFIGFADIVKDVELGITDLLRKNHVEIITDFSKLAAITTVKSYLYSIFYNLITNSIKYKQDGINPVVNITTWKSEDRVFIHFSDNGMGIDLAAHGSKLFGLYKRFHPEHAEGKGLGLFMTKMQVEALGGKISVESEVNQGTRFTIEL